MPDTLAPPTLPMPVPAINTVTIKNITTETLEMMRDFQSYWLKPGEAWSLDADTGQWFANKWWIQLDIVDEGKSMTSPPIYDPRGNFPAVRSSKRVGRMSCKMCGAMFRSQFELIDHFSSHDNEILAQRMKNALTKEMDAEIPENARVEIPLESPKVEAVKAAPTTLDCPLCPKKYNAPHTLASHLQTHSKEDWEKQKAQVA